MSPLSTTVLGGGALLSSPALYQCLVDGTMPLETALTRFLVALVVCWLAGTVLTEFVLPRPAGRPAPPDTSPPPQAPASADPLLDASPADIADAVTTMTSED